MADTDETKPLIGAVADATPLSALRFRQIYTSEALFRVKSETTSRASSDDYEDLHSNCGQNGKSGQNSLRKTLSVWDLIGYGVGCTVGAGIYTLIYDGAQAAGPAVVLSFVLGAVACAFTALAYSEFASRIPVAGSAYTFAYYSIGELLAWVLGWNLTLEYGISAAAIARGWANYVYAILNSMGLDAPWLNSIELGGEYIASPLAALCIILCSLLLIIGARESALVNNVMTSINVLVILFVVFYGATFVDSANWTPFAPHGMVGIVKGSSVVFFSYLGFDMVSSLAEETRKPQVHMPIGIIASLVISAALYVSVGLIVTGMQQYETLDKLAPLSKAFEGVGQGWAATIISVGCVVGSSTAAFTCLMGQPRIFFAMARDGLLFRVFGLISMRFQTPMWGTLISGTMVSAMAFVFPLSLLANMISIGTLLAFMVVNTSVLVLRYRASHSDSHRYLWVIGAYVSCSFCLAMIANKTSSIPAVCVFAVGTLVSFVAMCFLPRPHKDDIPGVFVCPFVPFVPCAGVTLVQYVLGGLDLIAWLRFFVWMVIGLVLYFCYGIRNSKLLAVSLQQQADATSTDSLLEDSEVV